jgi:hypothetical protein
LDDAAFDQAGGCPSVGAGDALLLRPGAGTFVLDVADGQPDQLDHGVIVQEVAAVLDDLAEL